MIAISKKISITEIHFARKNYEQQKIKQKSFMFEEKEEI